MDVLTAHTPAGYLHAVTCDWPEGMNHGEAFRKIQERQGCTVRRYAMAEYLALRATAHVTPTVSPRAEAVPVRGPEVSGRVPDPLPEMRPPWEAESAGLPAVGAAIVHPVLGYAVVSHVLQQGGQGVAVVRGPRGEALVRGAWQVATDVDVPRWLRGDVPTEAADPLQIAPTCQDPEHVTPVPYSPHAWVQGPVWSVQVPVCSILPAIWSAGAGVAEQAPVRPPAPTADPVLVEASPRPRARAAGREPMPSLWGDV